MTEIVLWILGLVAIVISLSGAIILTIILKEMWVTRNMTPNELLYHINQRNKDDKLP